MKRQLRAEGGVSDQCQDLGGAAEVPTEAEVSMTVAAEPGDLSKSGSSGQLRGSPADGRHEGASHGNSRKKM